VIRLNQLRRRGYAGIDVAFAKRKRLPIVVCTRIEEALTPLPLRSYRPMPPEGRGNAKILEAGIAEYFAEEVVQYLKTIESTFNIEIERIGIDALVRRGSTKPVADVVRWSLIEDI
jgi:hypothetical protein